MSTLRTQNKGIRAAIYTAYLAPVSVFCIMTLLFLLPRFYFTYQGETHEAMGLFTLVSNTWQTCREAFAAKSIGPDTLTFAYVMSGAVILFWILWAWYLILSLHSLLCTVVAFSYPPTSLVSNRTKKLFLFAWFNHPCYVLFQLIPLAITCFPYLFLSLSDRKLGMIMDVTFFGIPDILILLLLTAASYAFFFKTLSAQQTLHMDLFRLYKKKQ